MTLTSDKSRSGFLRAPWFISFGAVFVCSWCGNQFTPLLLLYKANEHYSSFVVNAFLGVYVLGLAPALLIAGPLSDRHGRRPLMMIGLVTGVLASGLLAFGEFGPWPIYLGRLLAGATVGVAMAVGSSWIKELSQAPHDAAADAGSGARRASVAFTIGSASGALVAGVIAQWTPLGELLPFLIHVALTLPFLWLIWRAPETSLGGGMPGPLWRQLKVPSAGHKRFKRVVLVGGPAIFVAASLAYGYLPVLLADRTGEFGLAYATLLCVVMLVMAAVVQPIAKRIDSVSNARGIVTSLALIVVGLALVTLSDALSSLLFGLVASVVLGAAMGIGLVSGLLETQRIAGPRDLAGLTGVFYAVAYAGFLMPTILAAIAPATGTVILLAAVTVLAAVAGIVVLHSYSRHLPEAPEDSRHLPEAP